MAAHGISSTCNPCKYSAYDYWKMKDMETFCHQNLIRKGDALYSISCDLLID